MREKTFGSFSISLSKRSISLVEFGLSSAETPAVIPDCCSAAGGATSNAIVATQDARNTRGAAGAILILLLRGGAFDCGSQLAQRGSAQNMCFEFVASMTCFSKIEHYCMAHDELKIMREQVMMMRFKANKF